MSRNRCRQKRARKTPAVPIPQEIASVVLPYKDAAGEVPRGLRRRVQRPSFRTFKAASIRGAFLARVKALDEVAGGPGRGIVEMAAEFEFAEPGARYAQHGRTVFRLDGSFPRLRHLKPSVSTAGYRERDGAGHRERKSQACSWTGGGIEPTCPPRSPNGFASDRSPTS